MRCVTNSGLAGAVVVLVVVVAGCGSAAWRGGTQPTTEPPEGLQGAPKVQHPLNTTVFQKDPCTALTAGQLGALNIPVRGLRFPTSAGPGCGWDDRGGSTDSTTNVTFITQGGGVKTVYEGIEEYSYFRKLPPVDGYPAVAAGRIGPALPEQAGECQLYVGTADDQSIVTEIQVGARSPYQGQPCQRAQQVATEIMNTLKAGQ